MQFILLYTLHMAFLGTFQESETTSRFSPAYSFKLVYGLILVFRLACRVHV